MSIRLILLENGHDIGFPARSVVSVEEHGGHRSVIYLYNDSQHIVNVSNSFDEIYDAVDKEW